MQHSSATTVSSPQPGRAYDALDRLLIRLDEWLKLVSGRPVVPQRPYPAESIPELPLSREERRHAAALMRVNYSGEVAAQALYLGHALAARRPSVRASMRQAADEERDHLAWCQRRIAELEGRVSLLNPVWHVGALAIGAAAGLAGDNVSLGFVAETEHQVEQHLEGHLQRLPQNDRRSRAILEVMQADEASHGQAARAQGGIPLPVPVRIAMRSMAGVMTRVSYWI